MHVSNDASTPAEIAGASPAARAGVAPHLQSHAAARRVQAVALLSGFAGLGYEMVWVKMLTVSLGHEIVSVLAVLAAFFVGLGLGALALGRRIARSTEPARWYARIEGVIGVWALALTALIPLSAQILPTLIGAEPSAARHAVLAFGGTLLLLAPATLAMGATLPAAERVFTVWVGEGRHVGRLYALNTFGAVLGTLVSTFVLAPQIGFSRTLWLLAGLNFVCVGMLRGLGKPPGQASAAIGDTAAHSAHPGWLLAALFLTGLLGLGYEVVVVRVLSQVLENTVYTFAVVLAVYLTGTAVGAALFQRLGHPGGPAARGWLVGLTVVTSVLGMILLAVSDSVYAGAIALFGQRTLGALSGDLWVALLVFLAPTMSMGALFAQLAQQALPQMGLGRAVAANTLGSALAPALFGMVLMPAVGPKAILMMVALGYLLVLVVPAVSPAEHAGVRLSGTRALGLVVFAVACVLGAGRSLAPLRFVDTPANGRLVHYDDGVMAAVSVVQDAGGIYHLKVNNQYTMGSTSANYADHRQTHIPLLMHPNPERALFLGVGTGASMNAAQYHPGLATTAVELVPEVLESLTFFGTDPSQNAWPVPPRLIASDARRYVLASDQRFDVIVADLFHPSRDGAGLLYTREHFQAVRDRLSEDGLFCQWLPLFQMDLATLRLISRAFLEAFPDAKLFLPHFSLSHPIVGLIGSNAPLDFESGWLSRRVTDRTLQQELVRLKLNSDFAVIGGYLGGSAALRAFTANTALNTDDLPRVNYLAPRFEYEKRAGHGERLLALNAMLAPERDNLFAHTMPDDAPSGAPASQSTPLRASGGASATPSSVAYADAVAGAFDRYLAARDAYLKAGSQVKPHPDPRVMLEATRGPLLEVIRISPDFDPAYGPLLNMAEQLLTQEPGAAIALLAEMQAAAPGRPEAGFFLDELLKIARGDPDAAPYRGSNEPHSKNPQREYPTAEEKLE